MGVTEMFWNASIDEQKQGYIESNDYYICLLCGKRLEKGIIYQDEGLLYEDERFMRLHIRNSHKSVFEHLIELDKKITGLTEHQNSIMKLFYQGKSDKEVQEEMQVGSISTIRNHRFALKEKERQAKMFITMMELLKAKAGDKGEAKMDRKSELKRQYKETEAQAGVFQIRNTMNSKVLVMSTRNLKTINGKLMELKAGTIRNAELQKDLKEHEPDAFVIEVLEVMEKKENRSIQGQKDDLEKLEEKWLNQLKPYGASGYNKEKV